MNKDVDVNSWIHTMYAAAFPKALSCPHCKISMEARRDMVHVMSYGQQNPVGMSAPLELTFEIQMCPSHAIWVENNAYREAAKADLKSKIV